MMYGTFDRWFRQRIHVSWHIAWISVAILVGIATAPLMGATFADGAWVVIALAMIVTVCVKRTRYMIFVGVAAGLLIGLYRGGMASAAVAGYAPYIGNSVVVTGRVSEDTSYGPSGDLRVRLSDVRVGQHSLPGALWISATKPAEIKRGDMLTLRGTLSKGFGTIPASMYRAEILKIERPSPGDIGRRARDWFGGGVNQAMPADDANLAMGFLVGQKLTVSESLVDQLRTVGLIHAVVASGYHLTVLVGVVRRLFMNVSKYLSTLFSGVMIVGFIMITGFSPSMSRAGLVSGMSVAAWFYGRVIHPLVLLPFTAAVTALIQPAYVWGDVGWYLSFTSFAGVLLAAPLIHAYFWGDKKTGIIGEVLLATFAAQLLTLPLTVHVFGYFSAYALLANLLVVPLVPLVMLLTFIAGVVGLVLPGAAHLFGLPVQLLLGYMTTVVDWIAHLPHAKTELSFGMGALAVSYVAIGSVLLFLWRRTKYDFCQDNSEKLL